MIKIALSAIMVIFIAGTAAMVSAMKKSQEPLGRRTLFASFGNDDRCVEFSVDKSAPEEEVNTVRSILISALFPGDSGTDGVTSCPHDNLLAICSSKFKAEDDPVIHINVFATIFWYRGTHTIDYVKSNCSEDDSLEIMD